MINKHVCVWVVGAVLAGFVATAHGAEPTHKDVRYSKKYERSVLDIWTVKSDKPAPLVVNFHGGGFTRGDKKGFYRSPFIKKYHPKGVAFATVNYPFREHTGNSIMAILQHTAEAIKFLATNARKYNIDRGKKYRFEVRWPNGVIEEAKGSITMDIPRSTAGTPKK